MNISLKQHPATVATIAYTVVTCGHITIPSQEARFLTVYANIGSTLYTSMKNPHLYTSVINSGLVTVLTSAAMTVKNSSTPSLLLWLGNWLISWAIVCTYVYFVAPIVHNYIYSK